MLLVVLIAVLFLSACGHHNPPHANVPPPPSPESTTTTPPTPKPKPAKPPESAAPAKPEASADLAEPTIPPGAKALETQTGLASWYGPPYHNRRGSNGEVYNMNAMTAAHRTFPLGSIVRVTNLKTGNSALVRITDRGPFVPGRIVDLSLAAARKLDLVQAGVGQVKVELMESSASSGSSGKWAVQIGGIPDETVASKLADRLTRRYRTANVLRFKSPAGDWWIRVRVAGDDHERAQKLAAETETPEGSVFVVRLD